MKEAPFYRMRNAIRNYAWGSSDGISAYAGIRHERGAHAAECWMGAHPDSPSMLALHPGGERALNELIRENPLACLGERVYEKFGSLPFLFKALSAASPLSIQVHPDLMRAREGFDREESLGIPGTSPDRNYKDRNHKPELAVALSPFTALCGFRAPEEAASLLGAELRDYLGFSAKSGGGAFRKLLANSLSLKEEDRHALERMIVSRGRQLSESHDEAAARAGSIALDCARRFPRDPGALAPLFLNLVTLDPGEGIFVPAGVMHAYLEGTILEIMATSDNVIRGGLTPKHIDVEELLRIVDTEASHKRIHPSMSPFEPFETVWTTPCTEFELKRYEGTGKTHFDIENTGPEILLCTTGSLQIVSGDDSVDIAGGESIFVTAEATRYSVSGTGFLYRVSVPAGAETSA